MRYALIPAAMILLAACGSSTETPAAQADEAAATQAADEVATTYEALSRDERIRQTLMPSIDSLSPAAARAVVKRDRPGGLIIMAPGTASQWRKVTKAAQAQARKLGLPPLLIAADQENGTLVRRMKMPVTIPGAMTLGAAVKADPIRGLGTSSASGELTGQWLRAGGVNVDFAPVADVNVEPNNPVIGIRSPSAFPDVVSQAVIGQVGGFDAAGVLATAKHFPGHGDTTTDSHLGLAQVDHSKRQMRRIDLPPFEAAIRAGIGAIMVAHVTVPAYDNRPATVSKRVVDGLLRQKMGYDGLVVSDSLGMAAVASRNNLYRDTLRAGVDVLLMPNSSSAAVAQVKKAVKAGTLPQERVEEATKHVLAAKQRLGILQTSGPAPAKPSTATSRKVARQIASSGITVLGSCRNQVQGGATVVGYGAAAAGVRQGLRSAGVGSGPTRVVVQSTSPGATDVWVATGSPYQALTGSARQRVLTYGDVRASGWAAGRALAGKIERLGGLPVKGPKPCNRVR